MLYALLSIQFKSVPTNHGHRQAGLLLTAGFERFERSRRSICCLASISDCVAISRDILFSESLFTMVSKLHGYPEGHSGLSILNNDPKTGMDKQGA